MLQRLIYILYNLASLHNNTHNLFVHTDHDCNKYIGLFKKMICTLKLKRWSVMQSTFFYNSSNAYHTLHNNNCCCN